MADTVTQTAAGRRLETGDIILLAQAAFEPVDDLGLAMPGSAMIVVKIVRSAAGEVVATTRITAQNTDGSAPDPDRQGELDRAAQTMADGIIAQIRRLLGGATSPTVPDATRTAAAL